MLPQISLLETYQGSRGYGVNQLPSLIAANNQVVNFTSDFFPNPQRTTITPTIAGNAGFESQGYRDLAQDAGTITPWYKSWWNSATTAASKIWNSFTGIQAEPKKVDTLKTGFLGELGSGFIEGVGDGITTGFGNLTDYYSKKWGLVPRDSQGGNDYVHSQPTQAQGAAVSISGLADTLMSLAGISQPKGMYSIAYPQSEGVPTSTRSGMTMTGTPLSLNSALIVGAIVLLYIMFKKKGK